MGALLAFFDFSAAFPSLAHKFIAAVTRHYRMPTVGGCTMLFCPIQSGVEAPDRGLVRGCADDIGIVIKDISVLLDIQPCFALIEDATGLTLKQRKCVLVPCAVQFSEQAKAEILGWLRVHLIACCGFTIAAWAVSLGFAMGPDAQKHIFTGPTAKCASRVK
eukprot:7827918-Karenia_brevis.AAC.1